MDRNNGATSSVSRAGGLVRPAKRADYAALETVFDEAEAFHREALPEVFRKPEARFPPEYLYNSLIEDHGSTIFVADLDEQLVGFVTVREGELPDESILVPRRFAVVDMLAVRKDRQRTGIGRALMEAAHQWTRERGIDRIELNVWQFNKRAIIFYQDIGYATASRLMWRSV